MAGRARIERLSGVLTSGRVSGKVALITGAGQGLGRATAELFAREGATLALADLNEATVAGVAADLSSTGAAALGLQADVSSLASVRAMVFDVLDAYSRIDILVNNAGISSAGTVLDIDEAHWDRVMNVNLKSMFLCSQLVIPVMMKAGGGAIVCVSSASGLIGQRAQVAYNVSKHGVIGLVRCMAADHAADGIRVNAVCPGIINSPMLRSIPENELGDKLSSNVFGRAAEPLEIAYEILHLASDESSFTTGAAVAVDAGTTSALR